MKTKKRVLFTVVMSAIIISGCTVLSFYPLYTDDVLIKDDRIIGTWETYESSLLSSELKDTLVWEIVFNDKKWVRKLNTPFDRGSNEEPNKFAYTLFLYYASNQEIKAELQLHIVEIDGKTYLDFFPEEWARNIPILEMHLVGVHSFAKVNIDNDSIAIHWFDSEWFEHNLKENKIHIKHEKNSSNIMLTAQPKELQQFVKKYSDDKDAFDPDAQFILKPRK